VTTSTPLRDQLILELHQRGLSQRQIAKKLGNTITQAGISHALKRLKGEPRKRAAWDGPHPTGDPAKARDLSKVIACGGCGKLAWRGQRRSAVYVCADCRGSWSA
jgi:hypothetical protein